MGILDGILTGYTNAILGAAPTDVGGAYSKLQTELNSKYEKSKQAFEADPANKDKVFQMPDALQRWNDQIQGMMTSGDPTLQKQAMEQMTDYHKRATEMGKDATPNSVREYQFAQQQGFQGTYEQWIKSKAAAGRTNISIGGGQEDKWVPLDQLKNFTDANNNPIPPGTTYGQLASMGAKAIQTEAQGKSGTGTDILVSSLNEVKDVIDTAPETGQKGAAYLRALPGAAGAISNLALDAAGVKPSESDTRFTNATRMLTGQITNLMNGASASEGERDYWATIQPQITDNKQTRMLKYNQMVDFAQSMANRARTKGVQNVPDINIKKFDIPKDAPKKSKSSVDTNLDKVTQPKSEVINVTWGQ